MPTHELLPQQVRKLASQRPDDVFLQEVDGGTVTYAEADQEATFWANFFRQNGVGEGTPVLVMLPTCIRNVVVWLGLAWVRAIEVPVNTDLKGSLLAHVLRNSTAGLLVTSHQYLEALGGALPDAPNVELLVVPDAVAGDPAPLPMIGGPQPSASVGPEELSGPQPHHTASVLYTSGTTGPSKGVIIPWGQMQATAFASFDLSDFTSADAFYCPFTLYHVTGKCCVYAAAMIGGRAVLRTRWDTSAFWDDIERYRCTATVLMGAMANFLYRSTRPSVTNTPLKRVLMAPLIPEVYEFGARFDVEVHTVFNMSEVSVPLRSGQDLVDSSSCGRPRPGYECRLVDSLDQEVDPGVVGELVLRPVDPWTMMAGYWQMPEATVSAWRNLWFHTGDAMRRDEDGNFYFVDRLKDSIRRRGENVSSLELEQEVMRHPKVLEAAAVGVPSEWGEEDIRVVAVLRPEQALDPGDLAEYLDSRLPRFMLPRYVEIVPALPKSTTGKIQKQVLRDSPLAATGWTRRAR